MKKIHVACISVILLVFAFCSLLILSTSDQPKYFNNGYASMQLLSLYDLDDEGRDTTTPVPQEYTEYVNQIFEDLSQMYGVHKSTPGVGYFHPHDNIDCQYSKGTIYISFNDYSNLEDVKTGIAHELTHYLSENGRFFGFLYTLDDKYIFGCSFSEGVTNYFSTKYYPDSRYYQYETHVAKLTSMCYGEEALSKDFFASDISYLRADFNSALSRYYHNTSYDSLTFTPFDLMTSFLNAYGDTSIDDTTRVNQMLAVDEMFLYYAKQKGCENEVKEEISSFANTYNLDYLLQLL